MGWNVLLALLALTKCSPGLVVARFVRRIRTPAQSGLTSPVTARNVPRSQTHTLGVLGTPTVYAIRGTSVLTGVIVPIALLGIGALEARAGNVLQQTNCLRHSQGVSLFKTAHAYRVPLDPLVVDVCRALQIYTASVVIRPASVLWIPVPWQAARTNSTALATVGIRAKPVVRARNV